MIHSDGRKITQYLHTAPTLSYIDHSPTASRCPNGEQGSLVSWQPAVHSFSPSIHFFDCSDPQTSSSTVGRRLHHLHRRQSEFSCDAPCTTACSASGGPYNATECEELSGWMWQRGERPELRPGSREAYPAAHTQTPSIPSVLIRGWCSLGVRACTRLRTTCSPMSPGVTHNGYVVAGSKQNRTSTEPGGRDR
jgi:hypothetical protein